MAKEPTNDPVCYHPNQNDIAAIKKRLEEGNARYINKDLKCSCEDPEYIATQKPYAIILGCADSRVIPERIFDTGPGELFVARVAGNIANDASIASIEYAVANLGTRMIVVLGHESCGAVKEAIDTTTKPFDNEYTLGHSLDILLAQIRPAVVSKGPKANFYDVVKENARLNAQQLKTRSDIINDNKDVEIYYAYYNFAGKVEFHHLNDLYVDESTDKK